VLSMMGGFHGVSVIISILIIVQNAEGRLDREGSTIQDINGADERDPKLFNVFTVVRFPNDPCAGSSKNGTCYTEAECDNKGGKNSGSCAQGFGVCCVFVANCGASVAENCTYFESTGTESGQCSLEVCPCSTGICQIRLDFTSFVITGPSTLTNAALGATAGRLVGKGLKYSPQTQCLTDTFTVRTSSGGTNSPPTICGTNTNEHMYAEMSDDKCNSLDFALGSAGVDATIPTRSFAIKITQIECNSDLRAPRGCTQWYYGALVNTVRTFNYNSQKGLHLANQNQNICVRQESGACQICWSATSLADFDLSGKNDAMKALVGGKSGLAMMGCCSYGSDGMQTMGFDCLIIPGAMKADLSPLEKSITAANMFCGQEKGLGSKKDGTSDPGVTICTKQVPFSVQFLSDAIELEMEAKGDDGNQAFSGFQLAFIMSSTNC